MAIFADKAFYLQASGNLTTFFSWIGAIAYTLQIYYDFSGYSDMAIGLGRIFGFSFPENFNYPYISESVQEFWRRWHITLSSWFRDYVYIPLGGSRCGKRRTYINYIIVFFMTGLWHGASFNFIIWGLFYGVVLIVERIGWNKILEKLPCVVRHIYTLLVIMIGWVFFRADSLASAVLYIKGMFRIAGKDIANFWYIMDRQIWFFLIVGIVLSIPHPQVSAFFEKNALRKTAQEILLALVFIIAICYMVGSGYSPFLYFRF